MKFLITVVLFFSAAAIFIMNSCINRCGDDALTYVADSLKVDIYKIVGIINGNYFEVVRFDNQVNDTF